MSSLSTDKTLKIHLSEKFPIDKKTENLLAATLRLLMYWMPCTSVHLCHLPWSHFLLLSHSQLPLVLDNYSNGLDLHFWARLLPAVSEKLRAVRMGFRALQKFNCIFSDQEITISSSPAFYASTRIWRYHWCVCGKLISAVAQSDSEVEVHMWLVYSWGRFTPCWKRGKQHGRYTAVSAD